MKASLAVFLFLGSFTASADTITLENRYDFEGDFNVGASLVITFTTLPLSSEFGSYTIDFDNGLTDWLNIPFTLTYPAAPAGAKNVQTVLFVPEEGVDWPSVSYQVEPVAADCGGTPCDYTAALFAVEALPPPVLLFSPEGATFGGPDAQGKSFDLNAVLSIPIPVHVVNRGYNARTTITISGPIHYDFSITAITFGETEVPEPGSAAFAGIGLAAAALLRRRRGPA